jgi:rRNA-processing protein FCF1
MDYVRKLFSRYRDKGILIDSNLLLLYFIGKFDTSQISKFKRTSKFTSDDFRLLLFVFKHFNNVVTTPNILTEVSNLSNQLAGNLKLNFYTEFAKQVSTFQEQYISSVNICSQAHFIKFGLTDSGIIELAANEYLILTDDFKLANLLESKNIDVINFNHIRFMTPTR